mmetsp:Transcript_6464/g.9566  ORF Transcript_6464/g.9566 Transcript_6464/m.9566 type:complete len:91 (+) Transcript_6464:198-470(+)
MSFDAFEFTARVLSLVLTSRLKVCSNREFIRKKRECMTYPASTQREKQIIKKVMLKATSSFPIRLFKVVHPMTRTTTPHKIIQCSVSTEK